MGPENIDHQGSDPKTSPLLELTALLNWEETAGWLVLCESRSNNCFTSDKGQNGKQMKLISILELANRSDSLERKYTSLF